MKPASATLASWRSRTARGSVRVRGQQHVGLVDPREPLDRGAVEADPLLEGALDLGRRDGDGLQLPLDIGEPQADEADVALLDRPQNVLLLLVHSAS